MSASAWLNRPGSIVARLWRPAYEVGYQIFKGCVLFMMGPFYRTRRVGPKPQIPAGGVVLCPNHASYLDPAFVQLVLRRRVTFIMTNDFYELPAGRWFFKLVGAVPVGRGRLARAGLRRAMALVRRGHAIVLFPEGRLSTDGQPNRAQRGISRIARRTGAPIVPVAIAGGFQAWPKGARRPKRARVRVAFGPTMHWHAAGTGDKRRDEQLFADEVMQRIAVTKNWIHEHAPAPRDIPVSARTLQPADSSGR